MSYTWEHIIPKSLLDGGEVEFRDEETFGGYLVEVTADSVPGVAYALQMLAMTFAVMAESVREGHQPQN